MTHESRLIVKFNAHLMTLASRVCSMPVIDCPRLKPGIEEFCTRRRDGLPPSALGGEDVGELKVELLNG